MWFKYLIVFSVFLFLPIASWADTHTCVADCGTTCSPTSVANAIAVASPGDTVFIPAGNCTWSSTLTIDQAITLQGAGSSSTIITHSETIPELGGHHHALIYVKPSSNVQIRITGIGFDLKHNNPGAYYREAIYVNPVGNPELNNFRIDHCSFTKGIGTLLFAGIIFGVVDNNTFINSQLAIYLEGGGHAIWDDYEITAGTGDMLFFEDNYFYFDNNGEDNSHDGIFYGQSSTRYVARWNTVDATDFTNCTSMNFVHNHGNQGAYPAGLRGFPLTEVYNNTIDTYLGYNMYSFRGGSFLLFNNADTTVTSENIVVHIREEECAGADKTWPWEDQVTNSFIWNNTHNGSPIHAANPYKVSPCADPYLTEDKDYFMHAPQSTGGKSSYPTRRGANDMTFSSSGANAYYPYTPYTYPHPLRNPKAPANLRIVSP